MSSRRNSKRFNRGRIAAGGADAAPVTPVTILGAALLQWNRADLGLTIGVGFDWQDQGSANHDYTNAVAAAGPSLNAADATLGNLPTLTFNGTTQSCSSNLQLPAPLTTPTLLWIILKQDAWTLNKNIVSGDAGMVLRQSATTPRLRLFCGSLGTENAAPTLATWFRVAVYSTGTISDYTRVGATNATGANAGNQPDATAVRHIGRNAGGTTFAACTIAEIVYANSDAQLAALDAYGTARYGAGLFA